MVVVMQVLSPDGHHNFLPLMELDSEDLTLIKF